MKSSSPLDHSRMRRLLLSLVLLLLFSPPRIAGGGELFPEYDVIRANIRFWEQIYSRYDSGQGVIHDTERLDIVYEVIELAQHGSVPREVEQKRIDGVKNRYRDILRKLAAGKPGNPTERRVLALFGKEAGKKELLAASERIRCQRGVKDRFREGVIRSGRYLEEMKGIFRKAGLPEDLAYLPHVESSFNYQAYSKFGAAGIWQFTRETGKRYLTIDYAIDERRDPIASTRAAARYLKKNHELLDSWPLAITAYNHGESGMCRAKEQCGSFPAIYRKYDGKSFGFASRNFYAEFLAARRIAANYRKYFGDITLDPPAKRIETALSGYLPIAVVRDHFRLDDEVIEAYNPALRPPVYSGEKHLPKGYVLNLPARETIRKQLAALGKGRFLDGQKASAYHVVQKGETASRIAATHKIRLRDLLAANNLDKNGAIYAGQTLRLPGKSGGGKTAPAVPSLAATAKKTAARPAGKTAAGEEPVAEPRMIADAGATAERLTHIRTLSRDGVRHAVFKVAAEETLTHFSDWSLVPLPTLRALNRLGGAQTIHSGQEIVVPLSRTSLSALEAARIDFHQEMEQDFFASWEVASVTTYRVKKGDTLWKICNETLELPVWLLKKYNQHVDLETLRTDQELRVPKVIDKTGSARKLS
ncbi:MAG: LysM peptidoglycan-binding domain-containing protein [Thermodesulfobacteriota bacterium]